MSVLLLKKREKGKYKRIYIKAVYTGGLFEVKRSVRMCLLFHIMFYVKLKQEEEWLFAKNSETNRTTKSSLQEMQWQN